jgi:hypothetical protein
MICVRSPEARVGEPQKYDRVAADIVGFRSPASPRLPQISYRTKISDRGWRSYVGSGKNCLERVRMRPAKLLVIAMQVTELC